MAYDEMTQLQFEAITQ